MKTIKKNDIKPDIATEEHPETPGVIDEVGMEEIKGCMQIRREDGKVVMVPVTVGVCVNITDATQKGIHMSRLYSAIGKWFESSVFSEESIQGLLEELRLSQWPFSDTVHVSLAFELPVKKESLVSKNKGWHFYPVSYTFTKSPDKTETCFRFKVTYSSTCPCSAALARQVIQETFEKDFKDRDLVTKQQIVDWLGKKESINATPHAQRSYADISLVNPLIQSIESEIRGVEQVLKTSVQALVKREDEQAFAKINGENLMFCEDAVRKLADYYKAKLNYSNATIKVTHQESLHAHNAVSTIRL